MAVRDRQVLPIEEWQTGAACRGPHAAVFFPPTHVERKPDRDARETSAKALCRSCAVQRECLEYSLSTPEIHGIWGGLNELERRQLLAREAS